MSCSKYNQKKTGFSPNPKLVFNKNKFIMFNKFIIFLLGCNLFMMLSLISNVIPNELNFFVLYVWAKARFFNAINGVANYNAINGVAN